MAFTPAASWSNTPSPVVYDSESPATFTGVATQTISGGQFVYCSGTNGALVTGVTSSFAPTDLKIAVAILADQVNGIALHNQISGTNNLISIARRGAFLVRASDTVSGGCLVTYSSGGVANIFSASAGSGTIPGAAQFLPVGRSLTPADSGGNALVGLNL